MGLDIYVRRIIKPNKRSINNEDYLSMIDDDYNYCDKRFPLWVHKFETTHIEELYDWRAYNQKYNIDINEMEWCRSGNDDEGAYCHWFIKDSSIDSNEYIKVKDDDIPISEKEIKIICYKEISYQRKGLNNKFYDDVENGIIDTLVWTRKELDKYMLKYCDSNEAKEMFKSNIIEPFIEGKDCVYFSW